MLQAGHREAVGLPLLKGLSLILKRRQRRAQMHNVRQLS